MRALLLLLLATACDQGELPRATPIDEALDALAGFRVEMCWCPTSACVEGVGKRMRDYNDAWDERHHIREVPLRTPVQEQRLQAIVDDMIRCQMRVVQPDS